MAGYSCEEAEFTFGEETTVTASAWLTAGGLNAFGMQVSSTASTMRQSLVELRAAKAYRRRAARTKAITFVTGVGLVAGGAGLTATGVGGSHSLLFMRLPQLFLLQSERNTSKFIGG